MNLGKIVRYFLNKLPNDVILDRDRNEPYMRRYYILKTRWGWIRIHEILRDDTGPLHDHPWDYTSIILKGGYNEITPFTEETHMAPAILHRKATSLHLLHLMEKPTWTGVITGPKIRNWGFQTENGWMYYRDYFTLKFQEDLKEKDIQ